MKAETKLKRILAIENPKERFNKLHDFTLAIGWHGEAWSNAMDELQKMRDEGYSYKLEGNSLKVVKGSALT